VQGDAALRYWKPGSGDYGLRVIQNGNAFQIDDEAEIVYVRTAGGERGGRMEVWVWTSGPLGEESSGRIARTVVQRLGPKVEAVYVGDSPGMWLYGQYPLLVPAMAVYGRGRLATAPQPTVYVCRFGEGPAGRCARGYSR